MKNSTFIVAIGFLTLTLAACAGGGSTESGTLVFGTLTQAEAAGAEHGLTISLRHEAGERIENVQVCALGECSTTDAQGQWGLVAADTFAGGPVLFSIVGHGIDSSLVVEIPSGANEVELDLQHHDNQVEAHHITVDGVVAHLEDSLE